ncbi:MAG: chorismate mutase [Bacilli bacterium]|nr:chorismate mutase [Bacilli bacterium]
MDQIITHRDRIDKIDNEIMSLLEERFDLSMIIGQIKSKNQQEVLDRNREEKILLKTANYKHKSQIQNVYQNIFIQSKSLQRK